MWPVDKTRERYDTDPVFRGMVDMMRMHIKALTLSPGEMRDACMLACLIEEQRKPLTPIRIPLEGLEHDEIPKGPYR